MSGGMKFQFTQDAPQNIQSKAREHFYFQANYEFMFIPSDTKSRKNRGRFETTMDKKIE